MQPDRVLQPDGLRPGQAAAELFRWVPIRSRIEIGMGKEQTASHMQCIEVVL